MTRTDPAAGTLLDLLRARYGDGRYARGAPSGRTGTPADWPDWVSSTPLRAALAARGVTRPWAHQARAAELAWQGRHVVVATGTGSGKSLAYLVPRCPGC